MNRFFKKDDKRVESVGSFKIPRVWWSRPYEYAFVIDYLKETDTILDVGCGLEHPFKHYAGTICKKVVALDVDKRVAEIKDDNVEFVIEDILNYKTDLKFDRIFIISTLEHTKNNLVEKFENMYKLLKDDGQIIMTVDYPILTPDELLKYTKQAGFEPVGEINYELNDDCLYHNAYKLHCYSLVLEKKVKKENKIEDRKTKVEKEYKTKVTKPKRTKRG